MYCMYLGLYPGWYYCWVPHLHCCLCNKSDTQQWAVSNKTKKKKCKEGFIQSVGKLQTLICSAILPINLKQRESGPLDYFVGFFSIYLRKYCSQQAEALCNFTSHSTSHTFSVWDVVLDAISECKTMSSSTAVFHSNNLSQSYYQRSVFKKKHLLVTLKVNHIMSHEYDTEYVCMGLSIPVLTMFRGCAYAKFKTVAPYL